MSPVVEVVRTYLELLSPEELVPSPANDSSVQFVRHEQIGTEHYRRLYHAVGDAWHWRDRNAWSDDRLSTYLALPAIAVWECLVDGETAGFFELEQHDDDGSVEVVYFGLVGAFIGRGLGKAMLTRAVDAAWAFAPTRVWLHTCTLDSPHALPNYKARGFREVKMEMFVMQIA